MPSATLGQGLTPSHTGRPCPPGPGSGGRMLTIGPWHSSTRWRIYGSQETGTSGRPGLPKMPPWMCSPIRAWRNLHGGSTPSFGGWKRSFGVATTGTVIWGRTWSPTPASWTIGRYAGQGRNHGSPSRFWGTWGTFRTPEIRTRDLMQLRITQRSRPGPCVEKRGGRGFHVSKRQSHGAT